MAHDEIDCIRARALGAAAADGELEGVEAESEIRHRLACRACADAFAAHGELTARVAALAGPALPEDAWQILVARARRPIFGWRALVAATLVAALVPTVLSLALARPTSEDRPRFGSDTLSPDVDGDF